MVRSCLFLVLLATTLMACGNKKTEAKKSSIEDFNNVFAGTIGNMEIVMQLKKTGSELKGQYYYSGKTHSLKLSGTMSEDGTLKLDELNDKGNISGKFNGTYTKGGISGNWMKPDGSKSTTFSVTQSTQPYEFKMATDINWNGKYGGGDGATLTVTNYKKGEGFDFDISIVVTAEDDDICEAAVKGKAKMNDDTHAVYSFQSKTDNDDQCELKFSFDGQKEITVEEVSCFYYHGARCTLDGSFTK